jgi:hypothetical protein
MDDVPTPAGDPPTDDGALVAALAAELAGKSDLVWVAVAGAPARPLWHVWHDDSVAVVTGGLEQPDPGLADGAEVEVILRSKENSARQLRITASAERLVPGTDTWDAAASALHPKRLNATDGEQQPERWRRESTLWLLHPSDRAAETPGGMSSGHHRAEPLPTDATTLRRTPFHAGRATRKRR